VLVARTAELMKAVPQESVRRSSITLRLCRTAGGFHGGAEYKGGRGFGFGDVGGCAFWGDEGGGFFEEGGGVGLGFADYVVGVRLELRRRALVLARWSP
jgi:hypothetical protein